MRCRLENAGKEVEEARDLKEGECGGERRENKKGGVERKRVSERKMRWKDVSREVPVLRGLEPARHRPRQPEKMDSLLL